MMMMMTTAMMMIVIIAVVIIIIIALKAFASPQGTFSESTYADSEILRRLSQSKMWKEAFRAQELVSHTHRFGGR